MKRALKVVNSGDFAPRHLTELHGAIGTIKLVEGHVRHARRSFRSSLEGPTDNTVAQADWANRLYPSLGLSELPNGLPRSYEANCWRALGDMRWNDGMAECSMWLLDEPFSSRPACLGSYIGLGLVGDYAYAEIFARVGLNADPQNRTLRNNLTVALAMQGNLQEADYQFQQLKWSSGDGCPEYVYEATAGLLRFRKGDVAGGRALYLKAELDAPGHMKAAVAIHRALEEYRLRTDNFFEAFAQAKKLTRANDHLFTHRLYEQHLGLAISDTQKLGIDRKIVDLT